MQRLGIHRETTSDLFKTLFVGNVSCVGGGVICHRSDGIHQLAGPVVSRFSKNSYRILNSSSQIRLSEISIPTISDLQNSSHQNQLDNAHVHYLMFPTSYS